MVSRVIHARARRCAVSPILGFIAVSFVAAAAAPAADNFILLASTTSTEQSGLLAHLIPRFRAASGIDVRVVAVGTGQAFGLARRGDCDVLLVHDPEGERAFVAEGWGHDRRVVMFNDFVLIGPRADPAHVRGVTTATEALSRIASAAAKFASRGDDSGTHRAERRIWRAAGIDPRGSWYRELGSGMGATLNTSAAMNAYTLSDRASWMSFANRQDTDLLFAGDAALVNPYSSIRIAPERHPHRMHDLAERWHRWLVSPAGQAAIAGFRIDGEVAFRTH